MIRKVTVSWLRKKEACWMDVARFEKRWPKGMPITLANLLEAARMGLGITWFAAHLVRDGVIPGGPYNVAYKELQAALRQMQGGTWGDSDQSRGEKNRKLLRRFMYQSLAAIIWDLYRTERAR
jgi:hypothetical protein